MNGTGKRKNGFLQEITMDAIARRTSIFGGFLVSLVTDKIHQGRTPGHSGQGLALGNASILQGDISSGYLTGVLKTVVMYEHCGVTE